MRRDVLTLREFYAGAAGEAARAMVGRKVSEAWGDCATLDVLGLGYATPYLDGFNRARRTLAAMPATQGVEQWPAGDRNRATLIDETALPFQNALFDRILVAHLMEESDDPGAVLQEVWRVLAPSGRVIVAAASRRGLWSRAESTPFGHGRPFTRSQLEAMVRAADLEPVAWSQALYAPPWRPFLGWAETLEQVGARVCPGFAGVILLEAVKRTFAVRPRALRAPVKARGLLQPAPARAPLGREPRREPVGPGREGR